MRPRTALAVGFLGLVSAWGVLHAQRVFKEYPAIEYENFPIPPDFNTKTEWVRARLRYPDIYGYPQRRLQMRDGREFPGYWTMDYPRSDRHLMAGSPAADAHRHALGRAGGGTRRHRRCLQLADVIRRGGGALVAAGRSGGAVSRLPDRGGFFMCDDFHGDRAVHGSTIGQFHEQHEEGVSRTGPSRTFPTTIQSSTLSSIWRKAFRFPAHSFSRPALRMRKAPPARFRTGAASATIKAASWSRSATTWIWATPGSTPTSRVSRKMVVAGISHRDELLHLRSDALAETIGEKHRLPYGRGSE